MRKIFDKNIVYMTALALFMLTFASCKDSEDSITPSGNYSPIRGDFPQGDSEYDAMIKEISDTYGVYLLYKDVTEQDLNRDWVSTGTGDVYVGGTEDEREAGAWDLPEEDLPFYVNFFYNHIFPNITPEFAQTTFPVKIYMIDNLRGEPRVFGSVEDGGEESTGSTGVATDSVNFVSIKFGNFDNWAISFQDETIHGDDVSYSLKQQRSIFITKLINRAREKGELTEPDEFWDGFDFTGSMDNNNPRKSNYKYKLGFIDRINDNFGTGVQQQVFVKEYITSCYYWAKNSSTSNVYDLVGTYIKNALWLTPEEFEARYPKASYPMVHEKYELIVNHIKEKYGIDLVGIAYGPTEEEE